MTDAATELIHLNDRDYYERHPFTIFPIHVLNTRCGIHKPF